MWITNQKHLNFLKNDDTPTYLLTQNQNEMTIKFN